MENIIDLELNKIQQELEQKIQDYRNINVKNISTSTYDQFDFAKEIDYTEYKKSKPTKVELIAKLKISL